MNHEAIKVLKELAENTGKRSKIGIVRELMPHIEETMKQGVTLADIHAALTEKAGIDIKFLTFMGSYKRIKKATKTKQPSVSIKQNSTPEKNIKNEPSKTQEKPGGFVFDASPKKEDWI